MAVVEAQEHPSSVDRARPGAGGRSGWVALLVVLAGFTVAVVATARRAPLWNDELYTYYFAHLPGLGALWDELSRGAEQTPPLFYVLTRASLWAFGDSTLAIRLPEVAGYLLACVCVYAFTVRRSSPLYGLVAVLLLIGSGAAVYAYEARPYALVLGFGGVALLGWQRAAEDTTLVRTSGPARHRPRTPALLALGVGLAAAVGSHYYAVLLFVPLGLGEAWRSRQRSRLDLPLLGAMAGGLLPLVVFSPLIRAARELASTFWAKPSWSMVRIAYREMIGPWLDRSWVEVAAAATVAGLVVVGGLLVQKRRGGAAASAPTTPSHELVALAALALLPVVGVVVAMVVTGAFTPRYALPAVIGTSVLLALGLRWLDTRLRVLGAASAVMLAVTAGVTLAEGHRDARAEARWRRTTLDFLDSNSSGTPVVIAGPHTFLELAHDADRGRRGPPLHYLADVDAALDILDTDTIELGLLQLRDLAPLTVFPYETYVAEHPTFLLYGEGHAWDWVTERLRADGYELTTLVAGDDGTSLQHVRAKVRR